MLADELRPEIAGNIYCNVIAACHELADFRRMRQWTEATERRLTTMPVAVVFAGICRVHRAQLQQLAEPPSGAEVLPRVVPVPALVRLPSRREQLGHIGHRPPSVR